MISISNKKLSKISKVVFAVLISYSLLFIFYRAIEYYKVYFEKQELTMQLQIKKNETENLKKGIELEKKRKESLEQSYMTKEEIDNKVKDIFSRMSIFDYELNYLDSKKMCIDRYVLVVNVNTQSENGKKAAEGILSYIGEVKKSDKEESIYYVDYLTKPKENQQ